MGSYGSNGRMPRTINSSLEGRVAFVVCSFRMQSAINGAQAARVSRLRMQTAINGAQAAPVSRLLELSTINGLRLKEQQKSALQEQ